MTRVALDALVVGRVYAVVGRGLCGPAVYRGDGEFVGLSSEFGAVQLTEELHWDAGAPFGTVHTVVETPHTAPAGLPLTSILGVRDRFTGRALRYDPERPNPHPALAGHLGWWRFADTDEPAPPRADAPPGIAPYSEDNAALLAFLMELRACVDVPS